MSKDTNSIHETIHELLSVAGFSRKGDNWYRNHRDVLQIINLQKSRYGAQYYLNFALWLKTLGEPDSPKEHQCHIRLRETAISSDRSNVRKIFDLEDKSLSEAERCRAVAMFVQSELLPLADVCKSLLGVRACLQDGRFFRGMVTVSAKKLLVAPESK